MFLQVSLTVGLV